MAYLIDFLYENNLADISNFIYGNEYGDFGSKIEAMCKHYLCKYGYEMAASVWLAIPCSWRKEVLDSDEFYVPTEWDRCQFIINLYKSVPKDDSSQLDFIQDTLNEAIRFCHLIDFQLTSLESITDVYNKPLVHEDKLYRACWLKTRLKELVTGNQTGVSLGATTDKLVQLGPIACRLRDRDGSELATEFPPCRFAAEFNNRSFTVTTRGPNHYYAGKNWHVTGRAVERGREWGLVACGVSESVQYADNRMELEDYYAQRVLSEDGKQPPRCETSLSVWNSYNSYSKALDVPKGYETFRICVSVLLI
jgi:hypothetical protein